jgi:hypothetical protein
MRTTPPLNGEPLISLSQAALKFPGHRGAERLHPATLTRWILAGVKAPDGTRVRLEAVRAGHRWLTSEPSLARFVAALTPPTDTAGDTSSPAARSPVKQQRAAVRAGAELARRKA